ADEIEPLQDEPRQLEGSAHIGVQGCRVPGPRAEERGAAPPHRPGPLPAGRPAVARGTVPADPPAVGRGARGDRGDAARLAPAAGHPPAAAAVRKLVIRIATDNPTRGHRRVHGELVRIGPAPRRTGPTWQQFLTAQARGILAAGFVHVGTVVLRRIYALIVIEHATRRVHLAGITASPDAAWTTQPARNVLMDLGQRAASVKFLITDRGGQFTDSFDAVFTADGIRILASPPQAPRANAICEPIIGTLRREVLGRMLLVNEHQQRSRVLTEYLRHY